MINWLIVDTLSIDFKGMFVKSFGGQFQDCSVFTSDIPVAMPFYGFAKPRDGYSYAIERRQG